MPSIDRLCEDLRRCGPEELEKLELLLAAQGLALLREPRSARQTSRTLSSGSIVLEKRPPKALIWVCIDTGGDCAALLGAIHDRGAFFVVKAKQTANLRGVAMQTKRWHTVDVDADGKPPRQVAQLDFQRADWPSTA